MSEYTMRPYAVHVRGCRHDGYSPDQEDYPHSGPPLICTGCGNGHPVDSEYARAAIVARLRRSCGICRPDLSLGVRVVRLPAWGRDTYGGLYAEQPRESA